MQKPNKMANPFQYNCAIICRVPQSFGDKSVRTEESRDGLDVDKARDEYEVIKEVLKNCEMNLIELEEDENYPDCCFVEDCAVVIGGVALVTRPGHASRQGEVGEIRRVLKQDLRLLVKEVGDAKATLDGGDVLFTGKEIFVGVGKRTNFLGAKAVADAFCDYSVSLLDISASDLGHLKDGFSMVGREIMAVAPGTDCAVLLKKMQEVASCQYKVMQLDSRRAVDMMYINGRLIHHVRSEMGDHSYGKLDEKIPYTRHHIEMKELGRAGGTISSLLIPVHRQRSPKMLSSDITNADLGAHTLWQIWN